MILHFFSGILLIVLCLFYGKGIDAESSFDQATANTSVWLSSGAYCPTELYLNRTYYGFSAGFVATNLISDDESDTHGYIGYHKKQKTIYVVLRGSTSLQNWIDDLDTFLVPYTPTGADLLEGEKCEDCLVHEGFHYAWSRVAEAAVADVANLRAKYPNYGVVVTGHSLGSLAALDLQRAADLGRANSFKRDSHHKDSKDKTNNQVRLFTFGAPRFGNPALASFASAALQDTHRITHYRDMAPHVPARTYYQHICGEWYEDNTGEVRGCEGAEDEACADQWVLSLTIADHMQYLGLPLGCSSVSQGEFLSVRGTLRDLEEAR
eukprot:CAMPEP_0181319042 /NCGR_PEP_ID=MMETSP1101-20121128/17346_1 /TAXON_ID=46948 /ORGANISM="Rhodomonas abbreviata, Strain Caron Lab Isolate" /LENGTH=321 /DNA_ID=CAMNT_0023426587 /DNA_START=94 /DNA_END=1059 /DNA_ORIENTATION=-